MTGRATSNRVRKPTVWQRHGYPRLMGVLDIVDGVCLVIGGNRGCMNLGLKFAFWDAKRRVAKNLERCS